MICAWVVTSSAVVASSAISTLGRQASAIAIITRCRMPPDSWCGYSWKRRSAAGMRTSRSSSTDCVFASRLDTLWWVLIASAICSPILMVGLSDRAGSWNTMARSDPRCLRSSLSDSPISSVPRSRADPLIIVPAGSSPMIARQLTVLPEPDSPMMASVAPGDTVKLMPSTARTSRPPTEKVTRRSSTCSRASVIA